MFEYAKSNYVTRRTNKRLIAAGIVSCLSHLAGLLLLISFPGLLQPGKHLWFHPPVWSSKAPEDSNWRNLVYLGGSPKLQSPSAATLKQFRYDFGKSLVAPAIRVAWEEKAASRGNASEREPAVRPTLGTRDPKPVPDAQATGPIPSDTAGGAGGNPGDVSKTGLSGAAPLPALTGRVPTIFLPVPSAQEPRQIPKKVAETASTPQPQEVPSTAATTPADKQKLLNPPQVKEDPKTFENEQQAIRTEGSGLFDTKGFPLGDYARLIIDRIKGNWSIPSNLRNSQGRSTLVFFIEKDGQVWDLRIVGSSGSSSLDSAAQQAIWESRPFPPLPTGFPGKQVGAKFVFSYNERQ